MDAVRRGLERKLGMKEGCFDTHHDASPWRYELVNFVLYMSKDPDVCVWTWLREGAPMGLSRPLLPGSHFPRVEDDSVSTLEALDSRSPWSSNHPSFDLTHGEARSPAWGLLEEQVNAGFAELFSDAAAAATRLNGVCHPSPLGNVVKVKDDGSVKHRLIQDLRVNGVNDAVVLTERQVLPRGIDHGIDLAVLGLSLIHI